MSAASDKQQQQRPEAGTATSPVFGYGGGAYGAPDEYFAAASSSPASSSPHYGIEDFDIGTTVASSMHLIRLAFIRKVYTILSMQLAFTTFLSAAFMLSAAVTRWALHNTWVVWPAIIGSIVSLVALQFLRDRAPMNMYLLGAFTAFESLAVAVVCAAYAASGLGYVVLQAAFLTLLVFVSLTAYCWRSKRDFSFLGGFLWAALLVVLGASVLNWVLGLCGHYSPGFAFGVSVLSALVFIGYLLFDTSMLLHHLSPDEYVTAAISLYLDVLNLFLHLLRILSYLQSSSSDN